MPPTLQIAQCGGELLDHWHGPRLARLRPAGLLRGVALVDTDRRGLEVDILPKQREQFAEAQAGERRREVDHPVLPVLFGTEGLLGLADGRPAPVAVRAPRGGGDEEIDLVR